MAVWKALGRGGQLLTVGVAATALAVGGYLVHDARRAADGIAQQPSVQPQTDRHATGASDDMEMAAVSPGELVFGAEPPAAGLPPSPPRFDLVRVDPQGSAVVAGQAAPAAEISVLVDGHEASVAVADRSGAFVSMFSLSGSVQPRMITLEMRLGDGTVLASDESVLLGPTPGFEPPAQVAEVLDPGRGAEVAAMAEDAAPETVADADAPQLASGDPGPDVEGAEVAAGDPATIPLTESTQLGQAREDPQPIDAESHAALQDPQVAAAESATLRDSGAEGEELAMLSTPDPVAEDRGPEASSAPASGDVAGHAQTDSFGEDGAAPADPAPAGEDVAAREGADPATADLAASEPAQSAAGGGAASSQPEVVTRRDAGASEEVLALRDAGGAETAAMDIARPEGVPNSEAAGSVAAPVATEHGPETPALVSPVVPLPVDAEIVGLPHPDQPAPEPVPDPAAALTEAGALAFDDSVPRTTDADPATDPSGSPAAPATARMSDGDALPQAIGTHGAPPPDADPVRTVAAAPAPDAAPDGARATRPADLASSQGLPALGMTESIAEAGPVLAEGPGPQPVAPADPAAPGAGMGVASGQAAPAAEVADAELAAAPATGGSPAILLASDDGVRVLQSADIGLPPMVADNVAVETITYSPAGAVVLGGRASGDGAVRLYLDNTLLETVDIRADGQWRTELPMVDTGVYTLRADEIDLAGTVVSRFETPFQREDPLLLARRGDAPERGARAEIVTVQPGYTLWGISRSTYGSGMLYVQVFEANRDQIRNPDLIYPGQVFMLPEVQEQ